MGKQQYRTNQVPYRVYSLTEFYRLAKTGAWPGANVEGVGFVHAGRIIPEYIRVIKKINNYAGWASIGAGAVQYGKFGSIRIFKGGSLSFKYYNYKPNIGRGWSGGSTSSIRTTQFSEARGIGKYAGDGLFILGIGCNVVIGLNALSRNDTDAAIKAGIDIAMGYVGTFGPVGFVISTLYFLIDPMGDHPSSEIKYKELTPIDNLRRKTDFPEIYNPNRYKPDFPIKEQPIIKPGKW